MPRLLPTLTVLALMAVPFAANPAAAKDCYDADNQEALTECAQQHFQKQDDALNAVYKQVMARLKGKDYDESRKDLVAAQRAWLVFRDAHCKFIASGAAGGTAEPMVENQCDEQTTADRVKELKDLLSCPEGDLACPLPSQ